MDTQQGSQTLTLKEAIAETNAIMTEKGISSIYEAQSLPESHEKNYLLVLLSLIYRQVLY